MSELAYKRTNVYEKADEKLLKEIWGYEPDDSVETIRVHIRHLRSKIDKISDGKKYIETIYGGGYKLSIQRKTCSIMIL